MEPLVLAAASDAALAAATGEDPSVDAALPLLTAVERERAAAFLQPRDRRDFVAGHVLARLAGARVLGTTPRRLTLVQHCAECGGPHGQPHFEEAPDLGVSLSHARGQVAAMVGEGKVGVDVEGVDRASANPSMWRMALSRRELAVVRGATDPPRAFLRQWVRKEALIKFGIITLDSMPAADLADLPVVDPPHWSGSRDLRWSGRYVLDWADHAAGTLGAAVADTGRPHLERLDGAE